MNFTDPWGLSASERTIDIEAQYKTKEEAISAAQEEVNKLYNSDNPSEFGGVIYEDISSGLYGVRMIEGQEEKVNYDIDAMYYQDSEIVVADIHSHPGGDNVGYEIAKKKSADNGEALITSSVDVKNKGGSGVVTDNNNIPGYGYYLSYQTQGADGNVNTYTDVKIATTVSSEDYEAKNQNYAAGYTVDHILISPDYTTPIYY